MNKLFFNSRDELTCVNVNLVAAVLADGNYSKLLYITGKEFVLTHGISKVEEALKSYNDSHNLFVRLGRSLVINHAYLQKIDLQKSTLTLGNGSNDDIRLNLSKQLLKTYKEAVIKKVETQGNKKYVRSNNVR